MPKKIDKICNAYVLWVGFDFYRENEKERSNLVISKNTNPSSSALDDE